VDPARTAGGTLCRMLDRRFTFFWNCGAWLLRGCAAWSSSLPSPSRYRGQPRQARRHHRPGASRRKRGALRWNGPVAVGATARQRHPEIVAELRARMTVTPEALVAVQAGWPRARILLPTVATIHSPILAIAGGEDPVVTPVEMQVFHAAPGGCEFHLLPDAATWPPMSSRKSGCMDGRVAAPVQSMRQAKLRPSKDAAKCCRLKGKTLPGKPTLTAFASVTTASSPRPFHYPQPESALYCGRFLSNCWQAPRNPLYVYSGDQIMERLGLFQQALGRPRASDLLCGEGQLGVGDSQLLADRGAGFDIVSGGELRRVLAAAPEAAGRVVFSGAGKTAAEIDLALDAGILEFNVEASRTNAARPARCQLRKKARFALRVNPDIFAETHPYISTASANTSLASISSRRWGIYKRAAGNRWLEACGVSVHIGSQIRSQSPLARR